MYFQRFYVSHNNIVLYRAQRFPFYVLCKQLEMLFLCVRSWISHAGNPDVFILNYSCT